MSPASSDYDLSSLRTGVMAGSPCPVEVMRACIERMHMADVTICYGMTETSPVSTQTLPEDSIAHRTETVGRVHPHVEVRIADPATGDTLERSATGELCTRGYSVMRGYWNDPARTAEAIDADGWMHTGDLAVMADDGYVSIVGRIKDMVIRGGENIYPREVEEYLYSHPDIVDVQGIGVPDERYGEELMVWVKLRPGATLTEEEVRDYCRGHIAHFKVPRYVRFVDEFPMTVTGKVQKYLMREQALAELAPPTPDRFPQAKSIVDRRDQLRYPQLTAHDPAGGSPRSGTDLKPRDGRRSPPSEHPTVPRVRSTARCLSARLSKSCVDARFAPRIAAGSCVRQPTRRRTAMITLRGGSGPVITRSCDWLACTHVVGPRAMPTWSMVPSQSPSRNTRSPALIGWLQKSTARPRRACAAAWWISDTPTREYAAIVSPEQSNAPGPAVKNTYGLPTWARANEIAAAAGPDGAAVPDARRRMARRAGTGGQRQPHAGHDQAGRAHPVDREQRRQADAVGRGDAEQRVAGGDGVVATG